jgi:amino acid transporter
MAFGAPFVLISIASMIFFLIYLFPFVDLWILRRKQADANRPLYAGGAKKVPIISILGIVFIFGVVFNKVRKKKTT